MNRKLYIYAILMVLFIGIVQALNYDLCGDKLDINTNCTMLTPYISCGSYTYQIYNSTGNIVVDSTMAASNATAGIYMFNITVPQGDYIVKICDNSTREIVVTDKEDGKMIIAILILIPLILTIISLVGAASMSEEHGALKIFLYQFSVIPFFASMHFALIAVTKYYNIPELVNAMGDVTYYTTIIFVILITYFILYWIYKIFLYMAKKKDNKYEIEY